MQIEMNTTLNINQSNEFTPIICAIIIIVLKLLINHKAIAIDFKKVIISVPGEITLLVLGFILSKYVDNIAMLAISLLILIIQYALERWLDDKLSGHLKWYVILIIIAMYFSSIVLYILAVFVEIGRFIS